MKRRSFFSKLLMAIPAMIALRFSPKAGTAIAALNQPFSRSDSCFVYEVSWRPINPMEYEAYLDVRAYGNERFRGENCPEKWKHLIFPELPQHVNISHRAYEYENTRYVVRAFNKSIWNPGVFQGQGMGR